MVLARTSKLQAVNKALQMMGESPLNSLQGLLGLGNLAETTVQRGDRLYDRKNNTYVFTEDLKGDMTIILDWDDLPEHARLYIMTKAGRELQENMIGSKDLTEINLVLEQEARSQFIEEETTLSEHSMLRGHARRTHPVLGYKPINVMQR